MFHVHFPRRISRSCGRDLCTRLRRCAGASFILCFPCDEALREHRTRLQVFRLKSFLAVNLSTRQHEATLAAIVERAQFIDLRYMRLDDLPDKKTVLLHHFVVIQTAFEIRIAFVDQRRLHPPGFSSGESGCRELVALVSVAVADLNDLIQQFDRRDVDDAFPTFADGLEAQLPSQM